MKGVAVNNIRFGKKYYLTNYGEMYEFEVIEIKDNDEFKLRDVHTLEIYYMSDITRYGRGEDFELREL